MKVVIIEDERLALEKLGRYLIKYDPTIEIIAKLPSVAESVEWFSNHENAQYDVIFMDIQLTDGLSFEIFNLVKVSKPIIFTTAYDEYAIDAFKVNSVDYLLKPVTFTALTQAINKLKSFQSALLPPEIIAKVSESFSQKKVKDRFLVRLGNHIHSVNVEEIALFYAEGRNVFLITKEDKKYIIDYNLEDLIKLISDADFFRVNRTFIMNINEIEDVALYSNSRLKITPKSIKTDKEIIVSREKVTAFKKWLEGN
jgi:DNA-binding LytR/AlgR family response regulator